MPAEAFADAEQRASWIATKNMVVFSLWDPAAPTFDVDLFVREPFEFEPAYQRRIEVPIGRMTASVVALDDLLALKRAAGRSQDHADVEALMALHSEDQ